MAKKPRTADDPAETDDPDTHTDVSSTTDSVATATDTTVAAVVDPPRKPKDWEPPSASIPATAFSMVNMEYNSDNDMWKVVIGFTSQDDAKAFHDSVAGGYVMVVPAASALKPVK